MAYSETKGVPERKEGSEFESRHSYMSANDSIFVTTKAINKASSFTELQSEFTLFTPALIYSALSDLGAPHLFAQIVASAKDSMGRPIKVFRTRKLPSPIVRTVSYPRVEEQDYYLYMVRNNMWESFKTLLYQSGARDEPNKTAYFFAFGTCRIPDVVKKGEHSFLDINYISVVSNKTIFGFYPEIGGLPTAGINVPPPAAVQKAESMLSFSSKVMLKDIYGCTVDGIFNKNDNPFVK